MLAYTLTHPVKTGQPQLTYNALGRQIRETKVEENKFMEWMGREAGSDCLFRL